jgi:4-amino-4-deoxy-L-arabinose transferase-like glycosyltransferase
MMGVRAPQHAEPSPSLSVSPARPLPLTRYLTAGRTTALLLGGITLLGLGIRLYGLTGYGIWFDEAYHIALVQQPPVGAMLDAVLSNPPSDPLYVLLLRPWVGLFGSSDGAVRLLSVLFSTATLPATYALGRALAGRGAGLLGALFFALSPYAVELGQEAALYALAALTTTLALVAGWRWRAIGRGGALYLLLGIVAIYSHYVVAAILAGFALLALLPAAGPRRVTGRAWLGAHALIGAAWLPWLAALAVHWLDSAQPRATLQHTATASEVIGALVQFSSGTAVLQQGNRVLLALGLVAGAGLLALGWRAGGTPARRGLRLVVVLSAAIFLLPALLSAVTGRWLFVPHFMLFLLPALCVVLGAGGWGLGVGEVRGRSDKGRGIRDQGSGIRDQGSGIRHEPPTTRNPQSAIRNPQSVSLAALLLAWGAAQVGGLVLYNRYPPHGADGLRELAAVLRQEVQPGEAVLVTPAVLNVTLRQYYPGALRGLPADFDLRALYPPYTPDRWQADMAQAFAAAGPPDRFWLVYRPELDAGGAFLQAVQSDYRQLQQVRTPYADLYRFARP